jgi:hypothetical protein
LPKHYAPGQPRRTAFSRSSQTLLLHNPVNKGKEWKGRGFSSLGPTVSGSGGCLSLATCGLHAFFSPRLGNDA